MTNYYSTLDWLVKNMHVLKRIIVIDRKVLGVFVLILAGIGVFLSTATYKAVSTIYHNLAFVGTKVVLDAGHGGVDSGAVYGSLHEKDITLDVTLLVRYYLVQRGIYVELTRDTDRDVSGWEKYQKGRHRRDLQGRVSILNRGVVGVSIHVNMSTTPNEQGAMVFYAQGSAEGEKLGTFILDELAKVQTLNHRKAVARSNLYVLKNAGVPVVLVELGFLSSPVDRAKFEDSEMREKLARAIASGILRYFDIEI